MAVGVYCDACDGEIPAADLRRGDAKKIDGEYYCLDCLSMADDEDDEFDAAPPPAGESGRGKRQSGGSSRRGRGAPAPRRTSGRTPTAFACRAAREFHASFRWQDPGGTSALCTHAGEAEARRLRPRYR